MNESVAELFSRNVLERPHTNAEVDQIIEYLRQQRREQADRKAKGLAPRKPVKTTQVEDCERKTALKAKGIDPKQLCALEQIAATKPDDDQKGA